MRQRPKEKVVARRRKPSNRSVKPKIYIFCEGKKTEPSYIKAYIDAKHPHCIHLKKSARPVEIKHTVKNTPKELVNVAVEHKKTLEFSKDQVWVVYDRESEARYSDRDHEIALKNAIKNDIKVALSNVCFEYWLLLHLNNSAPAMESCDGVIKSNVFKQEFAAIGIGSYRKNDNEISRILMKDTYIQNARINAERINQQTKERSV